MKIIIASLMLLLVVFSAAAQVPPTPPTIIYVCKIAYSTLAANQAFVDQAITYTIIPGAMTDVHNPSGKIGIQTWRAAIANNDITSPKYIEIKFNIADYPSANVWWFYRIQLGAYSAVDKSDMVWSEISDFVSIGKVNPSGKPIHK